ncbi:unnamed protein product, partial [Sphacelaria rigidula]
GRCWIGQADSRARVCGIVHVSTGGTPAPFSAFNTAARGMPVPCAHMNDPERASHGIMDNRKATFCAKHAQAGVVDVRSKMCEEQGCSTWPSFGVVGSRKAEFCASHARAGMVNVRGNTCGEEGCFTWPSCGVSGSRKAEFCATHARAGMVNVRGNTCGEEGCFAWPSCGV